MRTLYLECTSGISGDMTVAALLDLGADADALRSGLASLKLEGYEIEISRVKRAGIDACDFHVHLESESEGEHDHPHPHTHDHADEHHHGHDHHHHSHKGGRLRRNLGDILTIIDASRITPAAKKMATDIFTVVARAEAKVHRLPLEEVHFHEVGAVDSIVDIVAAAICVDSLKVERVICSPLYEGTGTVRCQHGVIPVPAPATLAITQDRGIPLVITDNVGEMVTPTGAAIVAALAHHFGRPDSPTVSAIGYGAGKREYKENTNLLRVMLVEEQSDANTDKVLQLDCNLDDITGEALAYACETLLAAGALDVWCTPVTMKKSRPAQLLSVLIQPEQELEMVELLLRHTTTIGVRCTPHRRHIMERTAETLSTPLGEVRVKRCTYGDICKTTVEYESARQLAEAKGLPLEDVFRAVYRQLG